MKKHYTIPFFIPHEGCPFTCIFCSQKKISGRDSSLPPLTIKETISKYLKTIPGENREVEVAFFGGSFTGLPLKKQESYLQAVQPYIRKGAVTGIRLSTRPDYIDQGILDILKKFNVTAIELGVQSLSDDVLKRARRGHSSLDVKMASSLIINNGFTLGHQMMVGLPGSTLAKELKTARMSVSMKATEVRIYPVLVIKGTFLASMWRKKSYRPLSEKAAIKRCARLIDVFKKAGVRVLRCGLHPSKGLLSGDDILDGPFHEAFGQKVETYRCGEILRRWLKSEKDPAAVLHVLFNPTDAGCVIGYGRENAIFVEKALKRYKVFKFSKDTPDGEIAIEYMDGKILTIGSF
jgi:histone acetyltransferase (RNA polymerase elongator complex component)